LCRPRFYPPGKSCPNARDIVQLVTVLGLGRRAIFRIDVGGAGFVAAFAQISACTDYTWALLPTGEPGARLA